VASKKKKSDYKKTIKNLSQNYWAISTVVLAILLIATLIFSGISSAKMSSAEVGQKILTFANEKGANAKLVSVNDSGSLYQVILSIKGQEVPVYATKDGKYLIPSLVPLNIQTATAPTQTQASPSKSSQN